MFYNQVAPELHLVAVTVSSDRDTYQVSLGKEGGVHVLPSQACLLCCTTAHIPAAILV